MTSLQTRQEKIKAKRMQTPFREFVLEIASWMPFALTKNNGVVSRYPTERMSHVVSNKEFETIRNDVPTITPDGDDFFANMQKLFTSIPINATIQQGKNDATEYADSVLNSKSVYLSFGVFESCSYIAYSALVTNNCSYILNSMQITNSCENIYYSKAIDKSSNIYYSKFIINSSNIRFSSNLTGCRDCIGCNDLQNVSYYINNREYTKDEYEKYRTMMMQKTQLFEEKYSAVSNISLNAWSKNVQWNGILFSSDIENGYYVTRAAKWRNLVLITGENSDSHLYDCCDTGINAVDFYWVQAGWTNANNYYCVSQCESCFNIYYSYYLHNCSYCIGCVGLKNKSYCIFNKEYSKEEREQKANEIFASMDAAGTLGQFFPWSMNPFYFNDTAAHMIMWSEQSEPRSTAGQAFTKQEVTALWYLRRDEPVKVDIPVGAEIIKTGELWDYEWYSSHPERSEGSSKDNLDSSIVSLSQNDKKWTINPDILKKIIVDEQWNYYRIVQMEYDFLVKHWLPLPRKHWVERLKENFILN